MRGGWGISCRWMTQAAEQRRWKRAMHAVLRHAGRTDEMLARSQFPYHFAAAGSASCCGAGAGEKDTKPDCRRFRFFPEKMEA